MDLVLVYLIFDSQTSVVGATDELCPAFDSAEDFVVYVDLALNKHHVQIIQAVGHGNRYSVSIRFLGSPRPLDRFVQ